MAQLSKAHRFDLVEVPERFGPREMLLDEARVKAFAFAQDDYHPWHSSGSPFGGPVGHASLFANELMQIYFERYRIDVHEQGGGAWLEEAHVEETLWFESAAFLGERVLVDGCFVEKYVKGGRGAVVLEGTVRGEDGRVIMGHRAVEYFAMEGPAEDTPRAESESPMRRVLREGEPGLAPAGSAHADILPGTPIAELHKTITFPQQIVFSTLDHPQAQRSVHTDFEIARRAGLSAPLTQGQQLACHICESMTRFFGPSWYTSGRVRIKFLGAVLAGETVRIGGVVRERSLRDQLEVLDLDVWVESSAGATVAVANASAAPPPGGIQARSEGVSGAGREHFGHLPETGGRAES